MTFLVKKNVCFSCDVTALVSLRRLLTVEKVELLSRSEELTVELTWVLKPGSGSCVSGLTAAVCFPCNCFSVWRYVLDLVLYLRCVVHHCPSACGLGRQPESAQVHTNACQFVIVPLKFLRFLLSLKTHSNTFHSDIERKFFFLNNFHRDKINIKLTILNTSVLIVQHC